MKTFKTLTVFTTTSVLICSSFVPTAHALFGIGEFAGNVAKAFGANKTITNFITNGVNAATGDPTAMSKLVVDGMKEAGVIGDAASCQAMSNLATTGASLVAAYYSGGTAAGVANQLGGAIMDGACKESFGSPASPGAVEAARKQYQQIYDSQKQQIQSQEKIALHQIRAGERIAELQSKAEVEKAKILAQSALDVENTKQNGETERAVLQSQTLLKMTEMNNVKELEQARIELMKVQVVQQGKTDRTKLITDAEVDIAKLQAEGRVKEAQALAEALVQAKKFEAEAQKATSQDAKETAIKVAEIQYDALRKMTESTNAADIEKARIEANNKKREVSARLKQGGLDFFEKTIATLLNNGVRKREIDAEIKKVQQNQPKPIPQEQNVATRLLTEWGWTKVACYPGAVFITGLGNDTICVNPSAAIVAGQYRYERTSNQLIPLTAAVSNPVPAPVQPAINVVPVQNIEPIEPQDTGGF